MKKFLYLIWSWTDEGNYLETITPSLKAAREYLEWKDALEEMWITRWDSSKDGTRWHGTGPICPRASRRETPTKRKG